jgi:hypothetical protein
MNAARIVERFVQGMVNTANANGIEITMHSDGKIGFSKEWLLDFDSPWIHINNLKENKCLLWRDIIYNGISKHMRRSRQFVHTGCQNCYKVVAKPQTYSDLHLLEEAMTAANWPSKIGIEKRPHVKGLYGAYFYNRGLKEGQKRLLDVKELVRNTLGDHINVYLKRGCTEMELDQGQSNKWKVLAYQLEIERLMDELIYIPEQKLQSEEEKVKVRKGWEQFAWKFDLTYEGEDKIKACVNY